MNGNLTHSSFENATDFILDAASSFGRHEFLRFRPWIAIPSIIVIAIASFVGTFGNILTLLAVAMCEEIRNMETIFVVNLALSDLYVTAIADPMSIIAKLEGEHFFDRTPKLCQVVASLCTISCVTSLMTIATMSFNRYIYVCHNYYYKKIFSKKSCVIICGALYCVGLILVLLNQAGIGNHGFDRKSLECIWDRMATYPFTVAFSITLVWIPCLVIAIFYSRLYLFVRNHKKSMANYRLKFRECSTTAQPPPRNLRIGMAKTLFVIYAIFMVFWAPYALIMVIDVSDTFSHEAHVYITTFAHLHPSINWLIYLATQRKFALAYRRVVKRICLSSLTAGTQSRPASETEKCNSRSDDSASDGPVTGVPDAYVATIKNALGSFLNDWPADPACPADTETAHNCNTEQAVSTTLENRRSEHAYTN